MTKIEYAEVAIKCLKDYVELEKSKKKMTTETAKDGVVEISTIVLKVALDSVKEIYKQGETK